MTYSKIAVVLPNWIGDVVMTTPALRAIHRRFGGDAEIVGIHRPYVREVLAGTPWLSRTIVYTPTWQDPVLGWSSSIRRLREERFDLALLFANSLSTAMLAWLGHVRERVGFPGNLRSWALTRVLSRRAARRGRPVLPDVDAHLELAYAIGCPPEEKRLELATLPEDEAAADQVWRQCGLPDDGRVVVFNGSGGWGGIGQSKAWPPEYFAELARRVTAWCDWHVLVNCGPNERSIAAKIVDHARCERVHSLDWG
jgi:heptosyltransferase-2